MSGSELIVVVLAGLLLLGGKRMVKVARQWMKISRELRRNFEELKREAGLDLDDLDKDIRKKLE